MASPVPSPTIPTTYITTHDPQGYSVFRSLNVKLLNPRVAILYSQPGPLPVDFTNDADLTAHETRVASPSLGLIPTSGSTTIICEWPPEAGVTTASSMHRTQSLDIGVMTAGEIELVLDSGETRRLRAGDVLIHRGTMHSWRNTSETETARMVVTVLPSEKVTVGGKVQD
ncbi:MAG: hypothetical protein M1834_002079 [Cirrosporium novae-zelandiae]|nr:MAG: hypothetical protein M1834_002079 [Cirrosporium novae-zelandiae]